MARTITVKGTGRLSLKPDYTVVSLSLQTVKKEYDDAISDAAWQLDLLREALVKTGFSGDSLKTSDFSVSTEYMNRREKNGDYTRVFTGYRVSHMLRLEFDFDTARLSKVLGAISGCVAEPDLSIKFTVKDRDGVSEALLESACVNARTKAEILAKASGVSLGELISVDYNWGELHLFSPTHYEMEDACMAKACAAPEANIEIEPDDIDVRDTVTFVWEIK